MFTHRVHLSWMPWQRSCNTLVQYIILLQLSELIQQSVVIEQRHRLFGPVSMGPVYNTCSSFSHATCLSHIITMGVVHVFGACQIILNNTWFCIGYILTLAQGACDELNIKNVLKTYNQVKYMTLIKSKANTPFSFIHCHLY